ncbi:MAG: hypothetical protein AAGF93_18980 [Cyanobacteria bacterium P01_H01_bin.105]
MNVLSLFNNPLDTADNSLDAVVSLIPNIDFDSLIADVTDAVNDAISDVDQVIDAATLLVVDTLTNLDIDIETVDVSNIVEDAINFIAELPENATLSDVLSDIVELFEDDLPSLSEDELSDLLADVRVLLEDIAPNLSQLSIKPVLEQGIDLVEDLIDSTGIITIDGSNLSGELTQDGVTRSFTTELSDNLDALFADASDFLSGLTGNASLSDGEFTGSVVSDGTEYEWALNITDALTDSLTALFSAAEVTLPFDKGILAVDIDTPFGEVEGAIDFADGDLDLDLTTPLGDIKTSIAFAEDAQFVIPNNFFPAANGDLELDLTAGVLRVPIPRLPLVVPLDAFSGEFGLSDGTGTFTLDDFAGLPINGISTTFDVGPLASQIAIALTEDLSGDLAINAGEITGTIVSEFGEFDLTASVDDLILQASSLIDDTSGLLTLQNGSASIALNTPFGELSGAIALSTVEDALTDASNLLA